MSRAAELVRRAQALGMEVSLAGSHIRVLRPVPAPREADEVIAAIRGQRQAVIELLARQARAVDWQRLRPMVGKPVWTPNGRGVLVKVAQDYAVVSFPDGTRLRWYAPDAVLPIQ